MRARTAVSPGGKAVMCIPNSSGHRVPSRKWLSLAFAFIAALITGVLLVAATARSHDARGSSDYVAPAPRVGVSPHVRGRPTFLLDNGTVLQYVGMFSADAKFRKPSKYGRLFDGTLDGPGPAQQQAPPRMIHSYERAIESFAPPAHATAIPDVESLGRKTLDDFVTLVYGHQRVMQAPSSLTTDSAQRVIVADPDMPAIHVLDPAGKSSFRIVGGTGHRIQSVAGVAVDADDNIYIADAVRGLVVIFDRNGRFLREIGTFHGEPLFDRLTGIAIDREAGHLYLADGPRHVVVMLDLDGNLLARMGEGRSSSPPGQLIRRDASTPKEFEYPTEIAVGVSEVAVLDRAGTRVRILDLGCKLLGGFSVQHAAADKAKGIGIDNAGHFYISYPDEAVIRLYSRRGERLATFGHAGHKIGEFLGPQGLWIEGDRLYVADTENDRIDLFELSAPASTAGSSQREPEGNGQQQ